MKITDWSSPLDRRNCCEYLRSAVMWLLFVRFALSFVYETIDESIWKIQIKNRGSSGWSSMVWKVLTDHCEALANEIEYLVAINSEFPIWLRTTMVQLKWDYERIVEPNTIIKGKSTARLAFGLCHATVNTVLKCFCFVQDDGDRKTCFVLLRCVLDAFVCVYAVPCKRILRIRVHTCWRYRGRVCVALSVW